MNTRQQAQNENLVGCTLREGEYLVQRQLGQGRASRVYLALHTVLAIPLALKQLPADQPLPVSVSTELDYILRGGVITPRSSNANGLHTAFPASGGVYTDRFLREALLLARLQHPTIPTLYDYFFENGYWYLVMDYVPGMTLHTYLQKSDNLASLEILRYTMQICDVLDYLHKQTPPVLFYDLNPTHIMILPDEFVMLIDIGCAHYLHDEPLHASADHRLSSYAAPELYLADGKVDVHADLYSLGVILCEMLKKQQTTGMPPATASTALSGLLKLATRAEATQRLQSASVFYLALERAYNLEERQLYTVEIHAKSNKIFDNMYEENGSKIQSLRALDLELRRQRRETLQQLRYERQTQEQLELQLASVDESLRLRSHQSHMSQVGWRSPEKRPRGERKLYRLIQVSFLLVLALFVTLASLLVYVRVEHQFRSLLQGQELSPAPTFVMPVNTRTVVAGPVSQWRVLPTLPAAQADNTAVYVKLQGYTYIYVSGGYRSALAPSYDRGLYRYNIETAQWENVTGSYFPGMVNNAAAVDERGHIFFTAGYSSDTYTVTSRLYQYQPLSGTLQKIIPPELMPLGFGGSMLADRQGHLYITQGFLRGGNAQAQAGTGWYRYDIASGQWHVLAPLPLGVGYVVLTTNSDGDIFLMGGSTDAGQHDPQDRIYRYDPLQNSWTQVQTRMPQPMSGTASCLVRPDEVVVVGGYDSVHNVGLKQSWLFNLQSLHWESLPALPTGGSVLGAAACDGNGQVYLERGASNPQVPTRDFLALLVPASPVPDATA